MKLGCIILIGTCCFLNWTDRLVISLCEIVQSHFEVISLLAASWRKLLSQKTTYPRRMSHHGAKMCVNGVVPVAPQRVV